MIIKKNDLNFDWVLIDELAVGALPKKDSHLSFLKNNNIKSIFTLCSNEEGKVPKSFENQFNCNNYVLPDHKSKKLPKIEQITECINILESLLKKGAVYVHCFAGVERSPLICLAYLITNKNIDKQNGLEYMMQIHPSTNPLKGQLDLLSKL
tara:strand:+ start:3471 stop:3926 length:456 start_codon:yes stop_codon:yes gene_type:complete